MSIAPWRRRRRCTAPTPPTSKEPVSLKMVSGSISPSSSAAVAVIGLREPVGYPPWIARSAAERRRRSRRVYSAAVCG